MTLVLAQAAVLFVLPVLVVWVARASRATPAWELGLAIPFAVAVDLLFVLTLSRLFVLETAIFVSRGVWLAALAAVLVRRRRKVAWPAEIGLAQAGGALVAAALAWHL